MWYAWSEVPHECPTTMRWAGTPPCVSTSCCTSPTVPRSVWVVIGAPVSTDAKAAERIETEVYSHLYSFFSRYYEDADFISLRRRTAGKETYSIPYDGQEVVLHWTNKDQYYIKSSEDLKDYTFTTHVGETSFRVQFKLTRMDAIQNNNKASRIFKIDDEAEISDRVGRDEADPDEATGTP